MKKTFDTTGKRAYYCSIICWNKLIRKKVEQITSIYESL